MFENSIAIEDPFIDSSYYEFFEAYAPIVVSVKSLQIQGE